MTFEPLRTIGQIITGGEMSRSISYHKYLVESLKDPEEAAGYLNVVLEDGDAHMFLIALRNVAEAHGGMVRLSKLTKLNRSNLYKMLSKNGRPEIQSVYKVLNILGLKLNIVVNEKHGSKFKKAA